MMANSAELQLRAEYRAHSVGRWPAGEESLAGFIILIVRLARESPENPIENKIIRRNDAKTPTKDAIMYNQRQFSPAKYSSHLAQISCSLRGRYRPVSCTRKSI